MFNQSVISFSDAWFLAPHGAHKCTKDEFEPVCLNQVQAHLQHRTDYGATAYQRWVRENAERVLYLVISENEYAHKHNASHDVAKEENRVDCHESWPLSLLVHEHAPSLVHREGCPLAHKVSSRQGNIKSSANKDSKGANHSDDVVQDEVSTLFESVAKFVHAQKDVVRDIPRGDHNQVELRFLGLHEALLAREDVLVRVIADSEACVKGKRRCNQGV